jgi:hypothetical protein
MEKIIILLIIFNLTNAFGQTDKTAEEAINKFNSGEMEEAIGVMDKITNNDPSLKNWNTLLDMYYNRYEKAKERETNVAFLFGQTLGIKSVSSATCYKELVSKCREAELYSESPKASQLLRNYFIDTKPDSVVNEVAKKEFDIAENFFSKKDYNNSKAHYLRALLLQPDYYKATIYLGDSYWYLGNMDSAIYYFRKGIKKKPKLLEPRKYLVDALAYSKKNVEAKKECIEAIWIYPDKSMFMKYSDLVKREGKTFNKHWIKRECEVNNIKDSNAKPKNKLWKVYKLSGNQIKEYCDSTGVIVRSNTLTKSKYLEVYSWEKMLASSESSSELTFAKKMADLGYLDCYVFISEFHFDLYSQYENFARDNRERIKTYIEKYLIE